MGFSMRYEICIIGNANFALARVHGRRWVERWVERTNGRRGGGGDKRTNGRTDEGGKEGDRNGWAREHNEVLILQLVDPSIALDVVSVVRADERSDNNVILIPSIFFANAPIVVTYMHIPPLKVHIYAYNIRMYIHVYLSPSIFTGREKYSGREAALYRRSLSRTAIYTGWARCTARLRRAIARQDFRKMVRARRYDAAR